MSRNAEEFLDLQSTATVLATALDVRPGQVTAAIDLLLDNNTLPFIARYRKEATNNLDELALRRIEDGLKTARELAARKATILKSLNDQKVLTAALRTSVVECSDARQLEEIYLPFRPTRRTRATVAKERGLEPLADLLLRQEPPTASRKNLLRPFVDPSNDVPDEAAALQGACDIVADHWATNQEARRFCLAQVQRGKLVSKVKRGKKDENSRFAEWFDREQSVQRMPSHRFLAMRRGEREGVLRLSINVDSEFVLRRLRGVLLKNPKAVFATELRATVEDCWKRLLQPAAESRVMTELKQAADLEAVEVFARNVRDLLLAPPAGARVTLGIDPGFRTGCKVAVVDETGRFLETTTIYPTAPRNDTQGAAASLLKLIRKHNVELLAIGNGTASRETDQFVDELIASESLVITKAVVSESGASIYSASELAVSEYPELDVTVRGAISIAHRLQDPLAELVKLNPASIGVGQYQHDVDQALLNSTLQREVLSCVNSVGVELNQASPSLLAYVAGIGPKLAQRVVEFRDANGPFSDRQSLKNVPKFGAKAFEQSAGFLRIRDSSNPLDRTAIHPESYRVVQRMASALEASPETLLGNADLTNKLTAADFVDDRAGSNTVTDIIAELARPGRDPRREFRTATFKEGVNSIEDLQPGMKLEGVVTNVTKFGAFVDVGVHQDGLIHISQLAEGFVQNPADEVAVGDVVRPTVVEVDVARKRIGLSLRRQ